MSAIELDMFPYLLEKASTERISELEERQEVLRKALFKRWSEQEKKIEQLHKEFQILTGIIEGAFD